MDRENFWVCRWCCCCSSSPWEGCCWCFSSAVVLPVASQSSTNWIFKKADANVSQRQEEKKKNRRSVMGKAENVEQRCLNHHRRRHGMMMMMMILGALSASSCEHKAHIPSKWNAAWHQWCRGGGRSRRGGTCCQFISLNSFIPIPNWYSSLCGDRQTAAIHLPLFVVVVITDGWTFCSSSRAKRLCTLQECNLLLCKTRCNELSHPYFPRAIN